jgi:hypothetical protein
MPAGYAKVDAVIGRTFRGIAGAVGARPRVFAVVTVAMLLLHVFAPPIVLSLARKPVDYFAFNPWLASLPSFLVSSEVPLRRKLEAVPKLALFWFSSSNLYGIDWGFTVDVTDLFRFVVTSALIGLYFALWSYRRAGPAPARRVHAIRGGMLGSSVSVLGLSTGPCSVMGCGAPVMPVVGLAFAGLSSTTVAVLSQLSSFVGVALLVVLGGAVLGLGWTVGRAERTRGYNRA